MRIGDRVVNAVSSKDRDIAMVFQNYALYPHMTSLTTSAFALELEGAQGGDRRNAVEGPQRSST